MQSRHSSGIYRLNCCHVPRDARAYRTTRKVLSFFKTCMPKRNGTVASSTYRSYANRPGERIPSEIRSVPSIRSCRIIICLLSHERRACILLVKMLRDVREKGEKREHGPLLCRGISESRDREC